MAKWGDGVVAGALKLWLHYSFTVPDQDAQACFPCAMSTPKKEMLWSGGQLKRSEWVVGKRDKWRALGCGQVDRLGEVVLVSGVTRLGMWIRCPG